MNCQLQCGGLPGVPSCLSGTHSNHDKALQHGPYFVKLEKGDTQIRLGLLKTRTPGQASAINRALMMPASVPT
eukprot:670322-Pelagomonas_calceolata.AAC.1